MDFLGKTVLACLGFLLVACCLVAAVKPKDAEDGSILPGNGMHDGESPMMRTARQAHFYVNSAAYRHKERERYRNRNSRLRYQDNNSNGQVIDA